MICFLSDIDMYIVIVYAQYFHHHWDWEVKWPSLNYSSSINPGFNFVLRFFSSFHNHLFIIIISNNNYLFHMCSCYNASTNSLMLRSNQATNNQCPTSPKLSNSSIQEMQPRGSLESDDVYITEHLLRTFSGVSGRPEFFFRSFQAGFSVNIREPPCSVCGCNRTSEGIFDFISSNNSCNSQVRMLSFIVLLKFHVIVACIFSIFTHRIWAG